MCAIFSPPSTNYLSISTATGFAAMQKGLSRIFDLSQTFKCSVSLQWEEERVEKVGRELNTQPQEQTIATATESLEKKLSAGFLQDDNQLIRSLVPGSFVNSNGLNSILSRLTMIFVKWAGNWFMLRWQKSCKSVARCGKHSSLKRSADRVVPRERPHRAWDGT